MCVLYVNIGSKVRPRTFWYVSMGSAVLFILRSRLLLYSAGSGVNRVLLSGFSVRLFCSGKHFLYVWLYVFLGLTRACRCDGDVICVDHHVRLQTTILQAVELSRRCKPLCKAIIYLSSQEMMSHIVHQLIAGQFQ